MSSKKALSKAKKAAHKEKATSRDPQEATNKNCKSMIYHHLRAFSLRICLFPTAAQASEDKGLDAPPPKDEDPEGIQLVLVDDPLARAAKLLSPLKALCKQNIDVCCAQFDVAIRRSNLT